MRVQLAGSIPGEATNGLGPYAERFLEEPLRLTAVTALVAVSKVTTRTEDGTTYPTLRVHHWEMVPEEFMADFAKVLASGLERRTGQPELPFEPGSQLETDPFPEDDD